MDDGVEGPSATKKQRIEDRGSPRKWSGAAIMVYIQGAQQPELNMVTITFANVSVYCLSQWKSHNILYNEECKVFSSKPMEYKGLIMRHGSCIGRLQKRFGQQLAGPFLSFLTQTDVEKALLTLQGLHFWHCRQFSVGRSIHWSKGPDHCKLANEWVWQRS